MFLAVIVCITFGERSFSRLRPIKTIQDRLIGLAIILIESEDSGN